MKINEVIWVGRCPICRKDIFAEGDELRNKVTIKIKGITFPGIKKTYFCYKCWADIVKSIEVEYEQKTKES